MSVIETKGEKLQEGGTEETIRWKATDPNLSGNIIQRRSYLAQGQIGQES